MSEIKRRRGRPRLFSDEERAVRKKASQKKTAVNFRNVTINKEAANLVWDSVGVMSAKIGVKLTNSQVIILLLNDWLAENDPTGELRKDKRYIYDRERRTSDETLES